MSILVLLTRKHQTQQGRMNFKLRDLLMFSSVLIFQAYTLRECVHYPLRYYIYYTDSTVILARMLGSIFCFLSPLTIYQPDLHTQYTSLNISLLTFLINMAINKPQVTYYSINSSA